MCDQDLAGQLRTSQGAFFLRNTAAQLRFCRTAKSYVRESAPHDEDGVVVVVPGNGPGAAMVALAVGADSAANAAAGAPVGVLRTHLGIRGGPRRSQVAISLVTLGSQARSMVPWPVVGSGDAVELT